MMPCVSRSLAVASFINQGRRSYAAVTKDLKDLTTMEIYFSLMLLVLCESFTAALLRIQLPSGRKLVDRAAMSQPGVLEGGSGKIHSIEASVMYAISAHITWAKMFTAKLNVESN